MTEPYSSCQPVVVVFFFDQVPKVQVSRLVEIKCPPYLVHGNQLRSFSDRGWFLAGNVIKTGRGGGHWDFRSLRFPLFFRSSFRLWWLIRLAVSVLFRSRFSVFGKNKIGFSGLLFDAVWCFTFLFGNMRLNDLNRVHVLSDFACGFRFWSKFISVLRFSTIICTILQILIYSNAPSISGLWFCKTVRFCVPSWSLELVFFRFFFKTSLMLFNNYSPRWRWLNSGGYLPSREAMR